MTELEKRFDSDMREIYVAAKRECGYNAVRFLQMVGEKGGFLAAKQLINRPGGTDGFVALWRCGRLDLTVEAHVIKPEYTALFTEAERKICTERLSQLGYEPTD